MQSITLKLNGHQLDIEYTALVERDTFGTGDSPTTVDVDIAEVNLNGVNIYNLMREDLLIDIEGKIIDSELEEARYVA